MAFTSHNHEMETVELSQELGFHPATVSRILQILSQKGFLQHNGRTRKFILATIVNIYIKRPCATFLDTLFHQQSVANRSQGENKIRGNLMNGRKMGQAYLGA